MIGRSRPYVLCLQYTRNKDSLTNVACLCFLSVLLHGLFSGKAKEIVLRHKELQARAATLEREVIHLEEQQVELLARQPPKVLPNSTLSTTHQDLTTFAEVGIPF